MIYQINGNLSLLSKITPRFLSQLSNKWRFTSPFQDMDIWRIYSSLSESVEGAFILNKGLSILHSWAITSLKETLTHSLESCL